MSSKGTGKPVRNQAGKGGSGAARAARLKAALKANLGRRKAQARSRGAPDKAARTGLTEEGLTEEGLTEEGLTEEGAKGRADDRSGPDAQT